VAKAAPLLQALGTPVDILGARFTYGSFFMLALVGLIWFVLNRTAFGRHLYAVGDDPMRRGWPASAPAASCSRSM